MIRGKQGATKPSGKRSSKNSWGAWLPVSVMAASRCLRNKCREKGIPYQEFDSFLISVNEVYDRRECRRMSAAAAKHEGVVRCLKRRVQHSEPYEQILSAEKIRFLKKNLRECQRKWSPQFAECCDTLQTVLCKVSGMEGELKRCGKSSPACPPPFFPFSRF